MAGNVKSFTAGGAITKYAVVYVSGGNVVETTAVTDKPFGIAQAAAASGEQVPVQTDGITKAIATDAAVALGEDLSAVAGGEVDTNAGTSTHYKFATALEDSPAADALIEVQLHGVPTLQ